MNPISWVIRCFSHSINPCSFGNWNGMWSFSDQQVVLSFGLVKNRQMPEKCLRGHILNGAVPQYSIDLGGIQWACRGYECFTGRGCRHRGQGLGNTIARINIVLNVHEYFDGCYTERRNTAYKYGFNRSVSVCLFLFQIHSACFPVIFEPIQEVWFSGHGI